MGINCLAKMLQIRNFFGKLFLSLQNLILKVFKTKKKTRKNFVELRVGSGQQITRNLFLLRHEEIKYNATNFETDQQQEKSLVVILGWLSAKRKNTNKYADIWMERGFDVLTVNYDVGQLLWPAKGTQLVAADILKFLDQNTSYSQIMLHGFSAGGYLWAEVMVQMVQNMDRYQRILDVIVGQVWDSVTDVEEVPMGVSKAVFPRNKFLASAILNYMLFHLRIFDQIATRHYKKASDLFHTNLVKAPALLIFSKTDPIGTESTNKRVTKNWESTGIKVHWKVFEKSPHVGHYTKYPKEYIAQLHVFVDGLNLTKHTETLNDEKVEMNKVIL